MPCRWMSRARAARAAKAAERNALIDCDLPRPSSSPDVESWKAIRRQNLRGMRKAVRHVVLMMALMEAIRVGPIELVYAGKHGYPAPTEDDFGIGYAVGYFLSWLYLCVFMTIWVPLFSWWVERLFPSTPSDPAKPSVGSKITGALKQFNMILLPVSIGISLLAWAYHVLQTFIYVEDRSSGSKKLPANSRKNWAVRVYMLCGIAISTSLGYGMFGILADMDLAHVKTMEYNLIVVPVQINLGILLATGMQMRMEKRIARRQALALHTAKAEEATVDEKAALVEV